MGSIGFSTWNQNRRIEHGIKNGQLTEREAASLRSDQQEIKGAVKEARADGKIDGEERTAIRAMQKQASQDIFESKHNEERQPWAPPPVLSPSSPTDTQRMDYREARQATRIERGIERGSLSDAEAQKLVGQQQKIHEFEKYALSDGSLSDTERLHMERMQNRASRDIWLAKHNSVPGTTPPSSSSSS